MGHVKVRGWSFVTKDMSPTMEIHQLLAFKMPDNSWLNADDVVWMQSLGLKDKNGKELFAKDEILAGSMRQVVEADNYSLLTMLVDEEFEIVGNQYER